MLRRIIRSRASGEREDARGAREASPLARESRGRAEAGLGPPLRRVPRGRRVGQSERQRVGRGRGGPLYTAAASAPLEHAAVDGAVLRVDRPLSITDVVSRGGGVERRSPAVPEIIY